MKILIVGGNPNALSGTAIAIKNIINSLAKTDIVYTIHSLPVFQKGSFEANNNFTIVDKKISIAVLKYCVKNSINWLKVVFPFLKFSIRGYAYYFITLFYRGLLENQLKIIMPDVIHIHGLTINALPYIKVSIANKIPFVVTVHGAYSLDKNIRLDFNKNLERELLFRLVKNEINITTVSSSVKDILVNNFSVPPDLIKVVHNGVDFKKFGLQRISKNEIRDRYHVSRDKIVLLQVATLNKLKNHIAVLQAIACMDSSLKEKLLYLIVGSGREEKHLLKFVKKNELTKYVLFTGRLQGEKLRDMYHLSDFFILPSTTEGMPMVFLEALTAGLPIITFSDLGGAKDIYQPYCMELVHERSTDAILTAIKHAIGKKWDKQQIRNYAKNWDWESVCEKYKSCYSEAISPIETKKIPDQRGIGGRKT